jgi:hypothetical protein
MERPDVGVRLRPLAAIVDRMGPRKPAAGIEFSRMDR